MASYAHCQILYLIPVIKHKIMHTYISNRKAPYVDLRANRFLRKETYLITT